MNLGEARFAGETVRRSYMGDQGKARHGTQAPPGQEPRDTGQKTTEPKQSDPRSNGRA